MTRFVVAVPFSVAALALAGCGGDTNLVRDIAVASGVTGGEPKPPPDFVSRTRSSSVDYLPVGVSAPRRALPAKDKAAVSGAEAEMEALRKRNEGRAAQARRAAAGAKAE